MLVLYFLFSYTICIVGMHTPALQLDYLTNGEFIHNYSFFCSLLCGFVRPIALFSILYQVIRREPIFAEIEDDGGNYCPLEYKFMPIWFVLGMWFGSL